MNPDITVIAEADGQSAQAQALAARLGLVFSRASPERGLILVQTAQRLELRLAEAPATRAIYADFDSAHTRRRIQTGKRSLLARAIGLHKSSALRVIDATCGLGRDTGLLLALGASVRALERVPVLAALVEDAARRHIPGAGVWLGIHTCDSRQCLAARDVTADVIYIDPMFAAARRHALPKWEMQLLRRIAGTDHDADALITTACKQPVRRVVVKRHPRSAPLATPSHTLRGRRVCFDVYARR